MIIFLCGPKGSGKDAVAKEFVKWYPSYRTVAFADPIRYFVMDLFELTDTSEYDAFKRSTVMIQGRGVSGREIVRGIGMKMLGYDQKQFVRYVEDAVANQPDIIITDCRMKHEFALAKKIRRYRDEVAVVQIRREGYEYDGHVTESEPTFPMDLVIHNDSSIDDAVRKLHFYITGETKQA